MKHRYISITAIGTCLSLALILSPVATMPVMADDKAQTLISEKFTKLFKSKPDEVKETPIPGLYLVRKGMTVVYSSADANYMIQGNRREGMAMVDLDNGDDLTDKAKASIRLETLKKQAGKEIAYPAKKETHSMTVVTDIDCPYCAKLHKDVPALNEAGITVKYLFFPRSGPNTPSFKKAIGVWCSDDKEKALTEAKIDRKSFDKTCDNPILDQYNLAAELGVSGTPAIITNTGHFISGYMPSKFLIEEVKNN